MKRILIALAFLGCSTSNYAQEQTSLSGNTVDKQTGSPLPYVTIVLNQSGRGVISNDAGFFRMSVPENEASDSLVFSCIGYEIVKVPISKFGNVPLKVEMASKSFELGEVQIFPLPPEEYIKRAVEKIPENFADAPVLSEGYYAEVMSENGKFLKFEEAVTASWVPALNDTISAHSSVLHARMTRDIEELQFMKTAREKEEKKQARKTAKAERKGKPLPEDEDDDEDDDEIVSANFGGPAQILTSDPSRDHEQFMKPENFKKFEYYFEPQVALGDKKLMVIGFRQKRQIDQAKSEGRIYLDEATDAIVAIEFSGRYKIPDALRPLLLLLGLGISNPDYNVIVHYREKNGRWYLSDSKRELSLEMTKKYMFSKNEKSTFHIEQIYVVNDLKTENIEPIQKSLRMDMSKPMVSQAQYQNPDFWKNYFPVRPQKLEKYLNPTH